MVAASVINLHGGLALLQLLETLLSVATAEADTTSPFLFTETCSSILEPNLKRGVYIVVIYAFMCSMLSVQLLCPNARCIYATYTHTSVLAI